jgi:hypothetical protein
LKGVDFLALLTTLAPSKITALRTIFMHIAAVLVCLEVLVLPDAASFFLLHRAMLCRWGKLKISLKFCP